MFKQLLSSKIHRATVTDASLDYEGSLAIDEALMREVGMDPYEKILVGNITNGHRFETYAIAAPAGSRTIRLNGAVAHLGDIGDRLVIMSFCYVGMEDLSSHQARVIVLNEQNEILRRSEYLLQA